jgi:mannose-6-phosphate isomerase-like protein (cupin superfamily)
MTGRVSAATITGMANLTGLAVTLLILSLPVAAAAQTAPPTDRTKATVFSSAQLAAALGTLPSDRPSASVRVFSLAPYNVNVERRLPLQQGASLHEAQAELFYVIDGSATLLTGGTLVSPTRTGSNLAGTGIDGGVRQTFSKGDFLLVPSGIPHQFVDIKSPVQLMSMYLPNVAEK